jgi:hypothetical protein
MVSVLASSGIMVSVLSSSGINRGLESLRVKAKTMKLVFVASPLSKRHISRKSKNHWLGTRIMCSNEATFLPRIFVSASYHYKKSN